MARKTKLKLKPAAKILILVASALALFSIYYFASPYIIPAGKSEQDVSGLMAGPNSSGSAVGRTGNCIEIGVVTWGGYAGGQYWNNGFKDNPGSKFHQDGICVNFNVLDDFDPSRAAFKAGEVDLLWTTIDSFPTESGTFGEPVKFLFQADWSRGGDAIVVKEGIDSVSQLAAQDIGVARGTPSHTFILWMLDMAGMTTLDVNIIYFPSALKAAEAFKSGKVDAAVVWSPDDATCVQARKGSKVLVNTKQAGSIIADGFIVKAAYLEANRDKLKKLVEGWLKGSAEINSSDEAKRKAAKILAAGFTGVDEKYTYDAINNVRLTTLGDNKDFFGLSSGYTGMTGKTLYEKMTVVYGRLNLIEKPALPWNQIADTGFINSLQVEGAAAETEKKAAFTAPTVEHTKAKAVASKPVRISFAHGSTTLDDNAKAIIDMMFVDQARAFPSSRIRVEGNTDSTGSAAINKRISQQRAEAVVDYLVSQGFDKNRFVAVGNGPDKPLCQDATEACMARNRRTDFQILEM